MYFDKLSIMTKVAKKFTSVIRKGEAVERILNREKILWLIDVMIYRYMDCDRDLYEKMIGLVQKYISAYSSLL